MSSIAGEWKLGLVFLFCFRTLRVASNLPIGWFFHECQYRRSSCSKAPLYRGNRKRTCVWCKGHGTNRATTSKSTATTREMQSALTTPFSHYEIIASIHQLGARPNREKLICGCTDLTHTSGTSFNTQSNLLLSADLFNILLSTATIDFRKLKINNIE